ncbi:MAG: hypothetical protein ABJE66_25905 [Deltaproteobacteria bacterium]
MRAAFLALTKKFHPARFGRMPTDIQRLSNEVFLGIKAAHELLLKSFGVTTRGGSTMQTGGMPVLTAEVTNRTQQRPGTPPGRAPSPPVRAGSPPGPAIPRTLTPTKHGLGPPTSATPPSRPATPPQTSPRPGTPPPRPGTPPERGSTQRIGMAPVQPPHPPTIDPPTTRGTGDWQPLQRTTPVFDERVELQQVLDALGQKNWGAAKALLNGLAARVPASKQYRALLAYTRGREAQTAGRGEDAVMEFQRALQLDPDLQQAKSAMAELLRRR